MPSLVVPIHLAIFLKEAKCAYQCGEGKFLSSDTKAISYSCVTGSEDHKYQWGKERPSVFVMNYMQFLEKEFGYVPIHPETRADRLNFRKRGANFSLNYICVVLVKVMGLCEVKVHTKMGSARLFRGI